MKPQSETRPAQSSTAIAMVHSQNRVSLPTITGSNFSLDGLKKLNFSLHLQLQHTKWRELTRYPVTRLS